MSNAAISPFIKTYPVFESNQVLSHNHLNDLRIYLDSESRLTRNQLIGTGIVHGLELDGSRLVINIEGGAGVTSHGYLITSPEGTQRYTHVKKYDFSDAQADLKTQMEKLYHLPLPQGEEATALGSERMNELIAENGLRLKFFELITEEEKEDGNKAISQVLGADVDAGVALYLEIKDTDIASCFTTSCDERGVKRDQSAKPLLIVTDRAIRLKPAFQKPLLAALPRLKFEHSNAPDLTNSYATACDNAFISSLASGFTEVDQFLRKVFREEAQQLPAESRNLLTLKSRMVNSHPEYLPCFYELLRDRRETLIELLDEAGDMDLSQYSSNAVASDHLMLGPVNRNSTGFPRSYFQPVVPDEAAEEKKQRILFLWKRLYQLLDAFDPAPAGELKVTPSHGQDYLLEDQSMPFFYNAAENGQLHEYWNHDLTQAGLAHRVPGYYNSSYNDTAERQYKVPLEYEHEDQENLLIEGVIGMQKSSALEQLEALRKTHHLAFGLIALRISDSDHDDAYHLYTMPDPVTHVEDNFKSFIAEHPGLYHARGIKKDWSLVLIFRAAPDETNGTVVGMMALPYICCGSNKVAAPEPYVLDAVDESVFTVTNGSLEIDALHNDLFDRDEPIEVELVEQFALAAKDDTAEAFISDTQDIHSLENDHFDHNAPLEVDLVETLKAHDDNVSAQANDTIDIHILDNDTTSPGDVALDFE